MREIYKRLNREVAAGRDKIFFDEWEMYFDASMEAELKATGKFLVSDMRQFYKGVRISIA